MAQLREDIRRHRVAAALLEANWVGITWFAATHGLHSLGFFMLLPLPFAARYVSGAPQRKGLR